MCRAEKMELHCSKKADQAARHRLGQVQCTFLSQWQSHFSALTPQKKKKGDLVLCLPCLCLPLFPSCGLAESSEAHGRRQGGFGSGCVSCIQERMAPPPPASHLLPSWQSEVWGDYASRVRPTNVDVANAAPADWHTRSSWPEYLRYLRRTCARGPTWSIPQLSLFSACRRLPSRVRLQVGQHGDAGIRKGGSRTAEPPPAWLPSRL